MGAKQSRQLYAFQPLPWPEALNAFRLIDQVCFLTRNPFCVEA